MDSFMEQYQKAGKVMPGGVNSSVRFSKARGVPMYVSKARGSKIYDLDNVEYIDMCCAHGAGLLGNAHPAIDEALRRTMEIGYANSFETIYHEELARKLCSVIPCADMIRFVGSGSEATLHLIRVCRAYTGKKKIIRMEGHFHGYHEMIYIGGQPPKEAFPENRAHPFIESPGIPEEFADLIVPVPFNDQAALDQAIEKHGAETAMVILEPVNFNSGGIRPEPGFLEHVREVTRREGILLFFDEVQSCFKTCLGGAQQAYHVTPDVCTIGKAIGGGFPLSAFCGREDIMRRVKPAGDVQHSGTFNAHLISVMTGLAFMDEALKPDFYPKLEALTARLENGINAIISRLNLNMVVPFHGPRFNIVFGRRLPPVRYEETFTHDPATMFRFLRDTFAKGVYFHDYNGGPAHHGFSIQHTEADIDQVLSVLEDVLAAMKKDHQV